MTSSQSGSSSQLRRMRTEFKVPKMDCPAEEAIIRLALAELDGVDSLELDARPDSVAPTSGGAEEQRTLWILLGINGVMFVAEMVTGWMAQSTGLLADGMDMLADAAVYGISLYVVGRAARLQLRAAHVSGWLQMALGLGAWAEVIRRFVAGSQPEPT